MRWPFHLRRPGHPEASGSGDVPVSRLPERTGTFVPPRRDWAALPPIRTAVADVPLTADRGFESRLMAGAPLLSLASLTHAVGQGGPGGLVDGRAAPAEEGAHPGADAGPTWAPMVGSLTPAQPGPVAQPAPDLAPRIQRQAERPAPGAGGHAVGVDASWRGAASVAGADLPAAGAAEPEPTPPAAPSPAPAPAPVLAPARRLEVIDAPCPPPPPLTRATAAAMPSVEPDQSGRASQPVQRSVEAPRAEDAAADTGEPSSPPVVPVPRLSLGQSRRLGLGPPLAGRPPVVSRMASQPEAAVAAPGPAPPAASATQTSEAARPAQAVPPEPVAAGGPPAAASPVTGPSGTDGGCPAADPPLGPPLRGRLGPPLGSTLTYASPAVRCEPAADDDGAPDLAAPEVAPPEPPAPETTATAPVPPAPSPAPAVQTSRMETSQVEPAPQQAPTLPLVSLSRSPLAGSPVTQDRPRATTPPVTGTGQVAPAEGAVSAPSPPPPSPLPAPPARAVPPATTETLRTEPAPGWSVPSLPLPATPLAQRRVSSDERSAVDTDPPLAAAPPPMAVAQRRVSVDQASTLAADPLLPAAPLPTAVALTAPEPSPAADVAHHHGVSEVPADPSGQSPLPQAPVLQGPAGQTPATVPGTHRPSLPLVQRMPSTPATPQESPPPAFCPPAAPRPRRRRRM